MISIEGSEGSYTATLHVRRDIGVKTGAQTEEGPWVGGKGSTPEEALRSLHENIGRAYVLTLDPI